MNELPEFISLTDFYHIYMFSAFAYRKTYSVQKSWLVQVLKNYSSEDKTNPLME